MITMWIWYIEQDPDDDAGPQYALPPRVFTSLEAAKREVSKIYVLASPWLDFTAENGKPGIVAKVTDNGNQARWTSIVEVEIEQ